MKFPPISANNLNDQRMSFPEDFEGKWNVVLIAFDQWHQNDVNTWLPFLNQVVESNPQVAFYEIPTVNRAPVLQRIWLDAVMKAGIPDRATRHRTVTIWVDIPAFLAQLQLPDARRIYVLLVSQDGEILWQTEGRYSVEKGALLAAHIPQTTQA
jgi:hypothetical protein